MHIASNLMQGNKSYPIVNIVEFILFINLSHNKRKRVTTKNIEPKLVDSLNCS